MSNIPIEVLDDNFLIDKSELLSDRFVDHRVFSTTLGVYKI